MEGAFVEVSGQGLKSLLDGIEQVKGEQTERIKDVVKHHDVDRPDARQFPFVSKQKDISPEELRFELFCKDFLLC